jgi:hypothetical protein
MRHASLVSTVITLATPAFATVSNTLVADSYIVNYGSGSAARAYSVMDVYIQCSSSADIVSSVFGVTAWNSSYALNNGKTFQHSNNSSWMHATSGAWTPWDSFVTTGAREQNVSSPKAYSAGLMTDQNFVNGGVANAGTIQGTNGGAGWYPSIGATVATNPFCQAGYYNNETGAINTAKAAKNISGNGITVGQSLNNLFMVGRFTIDVTGDAATANHTFAIRFAIAGKHNGTSTFTGSTGSVGRYDQTLTFAVPAPGAAALLVLGGMRMRRRR